jgi:hypothetical protein
MQTSYHADSQRPVQTEALKIQNFFSAGAANFEVVMACGQLAGENWLGV